MSASLAAALALFSRALVFTKLTISAKPRNPATKSTPITAPVAVANTVTIKSKENKMSAPKRIIPCLDTKNGRLVKGVNFLGLTDVGDPVEYAKAYNEQGADELVFLDITASHEGRDTIVDLVSRTSEVIFMPLTVGGGIKNTDDMQRILRAGADKVSLNTAAVMRPETLKEGAKMFGSQCIVLAVDARNRHLNTKVNKEEAHKLEWHWDISPVAVDENSLWEVYVHGGRTATGIDLIKWCKYATSLGAGEILLTSMDKDGTKDGYDNVMNKAVRAATSVPLVASGGAGSLEDFYNGATEGEADALLAASLFHFGTLTVSQVKDYLISRGVPVRPVLGK